MSALLHNCGLHSISVLLAGCNRLQRARHWLRAGYSPLRLPAGCIRL